MSPPTSVRRLAFAVALALLFQGCSQPAMPPVRQFMMGGDVYEVPTAYRPVFIGAEGADIARANPLERTKLGYDEVRRKLMRQTARAVMFHDPELIAADPRFANLAGVTFLSFENFVTEGKVLELPVGRPMYVYDGYSRIDFPGVTYLESRSEGAISTRRIVAHCRGSPPVRGTPLHSCRAEAHASTRDFITLDMPDELTPSGWAPVFDTADRFLEAHRVRDTRTY